MSKYIKWHDGIWIRKGMVGRDNDAWLIVETFNHNEYKLDKLELDNIHTICDVGASIGVFSILAHKLFPDAKITCIDPNPNTIGLLKANVKSFAKVIYGCIHYHKDAYIVFKNGRDFSTEISNEPNSDNIKVKPYTLKEIIPNGCDLLKLDCEGAEYDILEKEDLRNVRYILGEWHDTLKWYPFFVNYIAMHQYLTYDVITDNGNIHTGHFFMKNLRYKG